MDCYKKTLKNGSVSEKSNILLGSKTPGKKLSNGNKLRPIYQNLRITWIFRILTKNSLLCRLRATMIALKWNFQILKISSFRRVLLNIFEIYFSIKFSQLLFIIIVMKKLTLSSPRGNPQCRFIFTGSKSVHQKLGSRDNLFKSIDST
jgi:hypothetical protein